MKHEARFEVTPYWWQALPLTIRSCGRSLYGIIRWGRRLVATESFELVYDGSALASHKMDVRRLSPALLGLGNLIRDANGIVNQRGVTVRVYVTSGHDGCFSVVVEVWQGLVQGAQSLLGNENVKTVKDILEWLDLLKYAIGGGGLGVIGLYKWRAGRKITEAQRITDANGMSVIQIRVEGENNTVNVSPVVYAMSADPRIAKGVKDMLAPLKATGIDEFATVKDGERQLDIRKDGAKAIDASCAAVKVDENVLSRVVVPAHLSPYEPTFHPDATEWYFLYGGKPIKADISETDIAKEAVERRIVSMDDLYKVDLEITERKTPQQIRTEYRVVTMHGRIDDWRQTNLFEGEPPIAEPRSPQSPQGTE